MIFAGVEVVSILMSDGEITDWPSTLGANIPKPFTELIE